MLPGHVTVNKPKLFGVDLFCFFVLYMPHDHIESQLIVDQVPGPALKSHALVEVFFFVLAHSAVDIVDKLAVHFILLR